MSSVEVPDNASPELKLWGEVLFVGLLDAALYHAHRLGEPIPRNKFRSQSYWWIFDDKMQDAGSFTWCCQLFNLEPQRTRNLVLRRWKEIINGQQKFNNKKQKEEE